MYPRYIVKFHDRYLVGYGDGMIYQNKGGRNYIPKYILCGDGSLEVFKSRHGNEIIRRYNHIIEDYESQRCFFFEAEQDFMEEFFGELI